MKKKTATTTRYDVAEHLRTPEATHGRATPKADVELIGRRLKQALAMAEGRDQTMAKKALLGSDVGIVVRPRSRAASRARVMVA